jgi:hypothetical protein
MMSRITSVVLILSLMLVAGFFLGMEARGETSQSHLLAKAFQPEDNSRLTNSVAHLNEQSDSGDWPQIRATDRISIPFGIEPTLPLGNAGHIVQVRGHGGCTANELVTVQITLTHSTDYTVATGQKAELCSGDLQHWNLIASTATPLRSGAAEACGLATTRAGNNVTDTYEWCREVELSWQSLLPAVTHQSASR